MKTRLDLLPLGRSRPSWPPMDRMSECREGQDGRERPRHLDILSFGLAALIALAAPVAAAPPGGGGGSIAQPAPAPLDMLDLPLERPVRPAGENEPDDPEEEEANDEEPPTIYGEEVPTSTESIFYVLDISGSMNWDSSTYIGLDGQPAEGSKLARAKAELVRSIQALSRNFRFNIIAYDCSTRAWQNAMQDATPENKQSASAWVIALRAEGATGTGPACALALAQDRENETIVLLSDGSPNCGASGRTGHRNMILGANAQGARIHTFGIAAYGEFRGFLESLSAATGGRYVDVP